MILTIIFLIGIASISIEIADSTLSNLIKKLFFIDRERTLLVATSKPQSFFKVLPKWVQFTVAIPILIFLINIFFQLVRVLIKLLNCAFCISFHLGWMFTFFYLQEPLLLAFIFGGITIVITRIIDKFLTW